VSSCRRCFRLFRFCCFLSFVPSLLSVAFLRIHRNFASPVLPLTPSRSSEGNKRQKRINGLYDYFTKHLCLHLNKGVALPNPLPPQPLVTSLNRNTATLNLDLVRSTSKMRPDDNVLEREELVVKLDGGGFSLEDVDAGAKDFVG
jgi:hypothetical protein